MQLLIQIGGLLLMPFVWLEYKKACSNKFFTFGLPENDSKIPSKKNNVVASPSKSEAIFTKTHKQKKLNISFCESFKNLFSVFKKTKNIKFQMLNKSYEKIAKRLDIFFILKKLFELEKLKLLLLDEDQLRLFEYLPRPKISIPYNTQSLIEPETTKTSESTNFYDLWEDFFEAPQEKKKTKINAKTAFVNLLKKETSSDVDRKLIAFLRAKAQEFMNSSRNERVSLTEMMIVDENL